jgi:cysteinyl-tRNA synthetase
VIRFFFLTTHYRSPIDLGDFDPATQAVPPGLESAHKALENFYRFFERAERITGENFYRMRAGKLRDDEVEVSGPLAYPLPVLRKRFLDCMDDDFNTGGAVGILFELLTALNRFADEARLDLGESQPATNEFRTGVLVVRELSNILGLFWKPAAAAAVDDPNLRAALRQLLSDLGRPAADDAVAALMQAIIDLRQSSRKLKDFKTADTIRLRLGELGITLEDRPGGTDWRMA